MLSCACMLLLCLNGADIYVIFQHRLQQTGNFSGEQAAQICHQGRKAQQTTATVSKIKTYSKCNFFSNTILKNNVHAQSEGGSVQREILEHSPGKCEKTSQKPSQTCGVNSVNGRNRAVDVRDGSRGLITPATYQKYPCGNRCQKIRRLVKEFQKKRQIQLGLKQQRDYNDNNLQQNSRSHLDDARPSIERLFDISSTSESSAYEFGADKPDGVHTNGGNSERNHNGRNAKIESRSNLFSTSAGGGKKQRSRERHNARYAGIPHSGETSNLKKE